MAPSLRGRQSLRLVYILAHERGGPQTLSPNRFVLLRAASGALDELQAAASGMTVGKQVPGDASRSPRGLLSTNCDQTVEDWSELVEQITTPHVRSHC